MAKSDIPNALEMQAWKYAGRPEGQTDALAGRLRAAGRRSEAILLFDGRPEHPFLKEEIAAKDPPGLDVATDIGDMAGGMPGNMANLEFYSGNFEFIPIRDRPLIFKKFKKYDMN